MTRGGWKRFFDQNLWPALIVGSLTALVAFSFAVLRIADREKSELVSENYYAEGYNLREIVELERATEATGWQVEVVPLSADRSGEAMLQLNVLDRHGEQCDSLAGECAIYRPSDGTLDIEPSALTFIGAGRYIRQLPRDLERGRWEAVVTLHREPNRFYSRLPFFVDR